MTESNQRGVALIVGAGDGTGAAITRTFAQAGLIACPARRHRDKLQALVDSISAAGGRALAQSMARELGPAGIHVAHVIVDGPIDGEFVRTTFPQLVAERPANGILNPEDIAANYLMLHRQPRNAWTQELYLRPWVEPW